MKSGYLPIIIEIVIREINTLESRLDLLKGEAILGAGVISQRLK